MYLNLRSKEMFFPTNFVQTSLKNEKHWLNLFSVSDINVEHLQLLVFLFHGLTLMQKKSLWLQLCQCILKLVNNYGKQ